ncbi:S4 domain-containing protein [Aurantiacibacter spongiae]|uniref:RNA-binding S4 domain-containing protein n=1 Tax=Aurantiacibacter spongiae TaxID=2488860 RepID=A0A3N5CSP4_9SPHN|nr:S4 domain-containing protein [Aurantiacibacter spongiae]RPF71376.1 RNA-binding S4 domain-containing protein [Aurantiacibacter spongiae]
MRLDLLLCRLRFAKSRAVARRWIGEGHMRCNGNRVERPDRPVFPGDVLTLPVGRQVRVIAVEALPERRGPASEARTHYRDLDAPAPIAIAGAMPCDGATKNKGQSPP